MNKVIRNGMVAVLVSPGYGAGWYSWNKDHPECLFDPAVVAWVEGGKQGFCPNMEELHGWDDFYDGGYDGLRIEWIPVGTAFRIEEYDGSERVITQDTDGWQVA